jgi:hypothetical protein
MGRRWGHSDDGELKSEFKEHVRYSDLHSQSSQQVLEELAESFTSWYDARQLYSELSLLRSVLREAKQAVAKNE